VTDSVDGLPIRGSVVIPRSELRWRFSRSSGPGGQGVNTADSRVELRWDLAASAALNDHLRVRATERLAHRLIDGGIVSIVVSEERAQLQNRQIAERRLAALVSEAIAPPPAKRRPTKPSKGSVERRIASKKRTSTIKKNRQPPTD
jgi:ribosome-associated protein